jgi:hypothetical protein
MNICAALRVVKGTEVSRDIGLKPKAIWYERTKVVEQVGVIHTP